MRKLPAALIALVLVGALAGCGGSSDEATTTTTSTVEEETTTTGPAATTEAKDPSELTRDDYVAAVVSNLSTGSADDLQLVIAPDQAACIAPKWVDAITVDLLRENEVTAEELSDPGFSGSDLGMDLSQGEAMVDAFGECDVDIVELFATAFAGGLGEETQACVAENADPALIRALLAKTYSTGQSDAEFVAVLDQLEPLCDLPPA